MSMSGGLPPMKRCKGNVYGGRVNVYGCQSKAGYGPDGDYCKNHARELGFTIGETKTVYRVMKSENGLVIESAQCEETEKLYLFPKRPAFSEYLAKLDKREALMRHGIFKTERQAVQWFVDHAISARNAAHRRFVDAGTLLTAALALQRGLDDKVGQ